MHNAIGTARFTFAYSGGFAHEYACRINEFRSVTKDQNGFCFNLTIIFHRIHDRCFARIAATAPTRMIVPFPYFSNANPKKNAAGTCCDEATRKPLRRRWLAGQQNCASLRRRRTQCESAWYVNGRASQVLLCVHIVFRLRVVIYIYI